MLHAPEPSSGVKRNAAVPFSTPSFATWTRAWTNVLRGLWTAGQRPRHVRPERLQGPPSDRGVTVPMKLVIGIVRPEKTNDVLEALYRAEVRGLSMTRVEGHGGELDRVETYRGTTVRDSASDRKSTRLNSSHPSISYAVFCLKK